MHQAPNQSLAVVKSTSNFMKQFSEFAALAAKRWLYYSREGATITGLGDLRAAIPSPSRAMPQVMI